MSFLAPARHESVQSVVRTAIIIFLIGFGVRLVIMLVTHPYNQPLRAEIHHLAYSIASGHGYNDPYPTPTGPTALYSPGCPLILAGIYSLFGTGKLAEAVAYMVSIAAASIVFALLPLLSSLLGLPHRTGMIAATAGAIFPVYLLNEYRSLTATFAATCMVGLTLLTAWVWRRKQSLSVRLGVLFGISWGCALLIAPNLLLIGFLWLAVALFYNRARAAAFSFTALVVTLAVLSPWAIRNQIVFGSPIFSRSNLGLELWIANNDISAPNFGANGASQSLYQPFENPLEAQRVRRLGEAAYMREKMNAATTWMEQHPHRFLILTGIRFLRFWFPITYRPVQTVVVCGLTLAGIAGLVFTWFRDRLAFWVIASIWLAYPPVYYLVQLDNPYRYPMYWSILLLSVYGCMCSIEVLRGLFQGLRA